MNIVKMPRLIYLIGLGFLWLLVSCKSTNTTSDSKPPTFYNGKMEASNSSLLLNISMPYDLILNKLNLKRGKVIFDIKENTGVDPINIQLLNLPKIEKLGGQLILSNCQLKIHAKPSIAGINAGWIDGKINLRVQLDINSSAKNQLNFSACKFSYSWIEKPQVNMMGFQVNVSSILDKYIQSNEEKLVEAFLLKLNPMVDVNQWMPLVRKQLLNTSFQPYDLLNKKVDLELQSFQFLNNKIDLKVKLKGVLGFKLANSSVDTFLLKKDEPNLIHFYANKKDIEMMLNQSLKNVYTFKDKPLFVNGFSENGIKIEALKMFGGNSKILFDCQLHSQDSLLKFSASNISVEKLAFPYVFFKKSIKNKVLRNVNHMEINIQRMLNVDSSFSIIDDFTFQEIRMNSNGLLLVGKFNQAFLQINP
jgi:hypothetical protein